MVEIAHSNVALKDHEIHVARAGQGHAPTLVLLHGWPESWRTWHDLMKIGSLTSHLVAIDLPGIGGSRSRMVPGSKRAIAAVVHELIVALELHDVTLIGHDIGGMIAYAYLREFDDLRSAVIMDIPIPGVPPWEDFIRQPFLWHFALHAVRGLPEQLVDGREVQYFEYFYNLLSASQGIPTAASRAEQTAAYGSPSSLTSGFDWFREFAADAAHNLAVATAGPSVTTSVLYVRGEKERGGPIEPYVDGLRGAGVANIRSALVAGAGHFPQEEAPRELWRIVEQFSQEHGGSSTGRAGTGNA